MSKRKIEGLPMKQIFFIGSGISFGALTIYANQKPYFSFDLMLTRAVQQVNSPIFDGLMRLITEIGNPLPSSAIALFVYFILIALKKYKEFAGLFISTTGALLLSNIFKTLVSRTRPDPNLIHQIGIYLKPDSFPSGHVLFFVGFFGFLSYLFLKNGKSIQNRISAIVCLTLIFLIGLSRIYLGAHWFSDVMGAYLIGAVWLYIAVLFYKKF